MPALTDAAYAQLLTTSASTTPSGSPRRWPRGRRRERADRRRDAVHRRRRPHRPRDGRGSATTRGRWPTGGRCSTGCSIALDNPRVDGVLASADILEDLVVLGALDDKVAVGTMNRGGLAGARVGARRPLHRLRRRAPRRRPTSTPARCCCASTRRRRHRADARGLRRRRRGAQRPADDGDGRADPVHQGRQRAGGVGPRPRRPCCKAVGVCAALGWSSAYTWLKIQATADIATVAAVTTQPLLILGGAPGPDPGGDVRVVGAGAARSRPSAASSSAGRCCTRPTATSRAPSAGPPTSSQQAANGRRR